MNEECEKQKKLLDLYRAGKLDDKQKAEVEFHLMYCPDCVFLLPLVPSLDPN